MEYPEKLPLDWLYCGLPLDSLASRVTPKGKKVPEGPTATLECRYYDIIILLLTGNIDAEL